MEVEVEVNVGKKKTNPMGVVFPVNKNCNLYFVAVCFWYLEN